jgi:hypothetical protein
VCPSVRSSLYMAWYMHWKKEPLPILVSFEYALLPAFFLWHNRMFARMLIGSIGGLGHWLTF